MTFTAEQFTPTEWSTAEDKAKFANQFVRFAVNGFQKAHFPKWFYQRLSMTFGHIAHYNLDGFYETFFSHPLSTRTFIAQTLHSPCYGDPTYTYSDVERALKDWLWASGIPDSTQYIRRNEREVA